MFSVNTVEGKDTFYIEFHSYTPSLCRVLYLERQEWGYVFLEYVERYI